MTEFLINQGHRRFGFWLWKNAANTIQQRRAGIRQMLFSAGIGIDPELKQHCDPDDTGQIKHLIDCHRPDAIMCANDVFAAHLIKTLESLGIRVPGNVSATGNDDVCYAHLLRVPLTTFSQPCERIGRAAAQLMQERVKRSDLPPREILVTPEIAVRESTAVAEH